MSVIVTFIVEMTNEILRSQSRALLCFSTRQWPNRNRARTRKVNVSSKLQMRRPIRVFTVYVDESVPVLPVGSSHDVFQIVPTSPGVGG